MNKKISYDSLDRAIAFYGSQCGLAYALKLNQGNVSLWRSGKRKMLIKYMNEIDSLTRSKISCKSFARDMLKNVVFSKLSNGREVIFHGEYL